VKRRLHLRDRTGKRGGGAGASLIYDDARSRPASCQSVGDVWLHVEIERI
jgi:hypothetical protein